MITPNKFTPFSKSIIFKMLCLLENKQEGKHVTELYREHENSFENIDEFMLALDVLYVLGKIEINFSTGSIVYVT